MRLLHSNTQRIILQRKEFQMPTQKKRASNWKTKLTASSVAIYGPAKGIWDKKKGDYSPPPPIKVCCRFTKANKNIQNC